MELSEHINTDNWMHSRPMTIVSQIDGPSVSGISLTNSSPRQHIWTFACGGGEDRPTLDEACPCDAR